VVLLFLIYYQNAKDKRYRKRKGQSRMDNPETLATLITGRRQAKTKHTQKTKSMSNTDYSSG
jgi:hypothetical protein